MSMRFFSTGKDCAGSRRSLMRGGKVKVRSFGRRVTSSPTRRQND